MRTSLFVSSMFLLVSVAAPAPRYVFQETASDTKDPTQPIPDSQARAKVIYSRDCAMCHGENGNGTSDLAKTLQLSLEDWTNPKTLTGKTDHDLFVLIRSGKNKMPPEDEGRAKDNDVRSLIRYLRDFSRTQVEPATAPIK